MFAIERWEMLGFCMKITKKLFWKIIFCICIKVLLVIFEDLCFTW